VHGLAHASRIARRLAAWTVRHADAVGVVAHDHGPMLTRLQPRRPPTVLQNGIDLDAFVPGDRAVARRRLELPAEAPIVLYVGRLDAAKGLLVLCDALARVPAVQCVVAGSGPLEAALRARTAQPDLRGRVRVVGEVAHGDVPLWMAASDVVVLPSAAEGCPNVLREALACGRPVIATPVGDVPRLVTPDVGQLVPTGDADALADAIALAVRTPRDPARLRARVADMTWARNAEATHRFLASAMENAA
jgi:teichuronic acid biosynthesis glycosyltransferase TuaC